MCRSCQTLYVDVDIKTWIHSSRPLHASSVAPKPRPNLQSCDQHADLQAPNHLPRGGSKSKDLLNNTSSRHELTLTQAAVHARPQDDPAQPTTPTTDPAAPVDPAAPGDPSAPVSPTPDNLPGFCPSELAQDPDNSGRGRGHGGDCRCGQSLGLQVSDSETNDAQPLAAAPDWFGGGNCGCIWGEGQCGCYDGVSGGNGVCTFPYSDVAFLLCRSNVAC